MKIATVPASVIADANRLDAEFFVDPGGKQRAKAKNLRVRAEKLLADARDAELAAVAERARARALGVEVKEE